MYNYWPGEVPSSFVYELTNVFFWNFQTRLYKPSHSILWAVICNDGFVYYWSWIFWEFRRSPPFLFLFYQNAFHFKSWFIRLNSYNLRKRILVNIPKFPNFSHFRYLQPVHSLKSTLSVVNCMFQNLSKNHKASTIRKLEWYWSNNFFL